MSAKEPLFELNLFGTFQLHWQGQPLGGISSPKIQALLAYLAVEPAQPYSREQLATLLWPEHDANKGRQNLRQSLTRLGRALAAAGAPDLLQLDRQAVYLAPAAPLMVDYRQFRTALVAVDAHRHESVTGCAHCAGLLAEAVGQQRGPFLAGLYPESESFDEWALLQREWARREGLMALAALAHFHLKKGDYQQAYDYAWQQISLEPLDEGAQQLVLRALGLLGRVRDARLQFERFSAVLAEELGVAPLPETAALVAQIERGELAQPETVGATSPAAVVGLQNRPVYFTPFVGRAPELTRLAEYLAEPNIRLVTLLGPGGVGKTRLASEAAAAASPHFTHGAWFFPLAEVASQREMIDHLARALGLQFSSRDTEAHQREQRLLTHLQPWHALFVLDNFEQLLAARPFLTALLTEAPGLMLLVTSREPLELQAEWQLPLHGLTQTASDRSEGDSLALFTLLARQQNPDFVVDEQSRPHLLAICALLDGLPLGLELAAAWLRHMSAAEILAALQENLDFLQTNRQDIELRHRSLRAVFEQSWRNLAPEEQTQFLRLSLFRAGFDRAAAAAVAEADSLLLTRLYLVSLLKEDEERRYQLHPLVSQFARELLAADPALAAATERRLADYYLTWFEERAAAFKDLSGQAGPALASLDRAYENLRLAWLLAGQHGLVVLQHRVANAWLQYHILRSRAQDGVELFTAAIAALGAGPDDSAQLALRLRLHVGAARMYGRLNQTAQVVSHVEAVIGLNPGPEHVDELAR
ncbi:MAG: hypothetical protein KDE04_17200, partial [Anaerolineales bacterium]|nr:hypothetical protein [Anaerolineales bacterium]